MNLNDYKDGNGNVEVSETLVSDLIGGINTNETAIAGVVERGSNANGNWVKFDDGTMICTKRVAFGGGVTTDVVWGTLVYSGTVLLGDFPVSFITPPITSYTFYPNTATWAWLTSVTDSRTSTISAGGVVFIRPTAGSISGTVEVIAIGRWK